MSLHSDPSVQTKEKRTRIKAKLRLKAGCEVILRFKKENLMVKKENLIKNA